MSSAVMAGVAWPVLAGLALAVLIAVGRWVGTINKALFALTRVAERLAEVTAMVTKLDERLDRHEQIAAATCARLGLHPRYLDPATDDRIPAPR